MEKITRSSWRVFCIGFTTLLLIVVFPYADLIRQPTVAGDNLTPTPWHHFREGKLYKRWLRWLVRVPTVYHCNGVNWESSEFVEHQDYDLDKEHFLPSDTCPDYFGWILEDLSPWQMHGITRRNLDQARKNGGAFKVVIHRGKLYAELYYKCVYSRMMFTLWGLSLLLEKYPGQIPDVEFLFNCQDRPVISKDDFETGTPPPLFGYCSTDKHFDVPFPDWSFWGWPEYHIAPWTEEFASIANGSERITWENRDPHAFWKGTPRPHKDVEVRDELLACNSSTDSHMYKQRWGEESMESSKLANQCDHRFRVYVEGYAWSSSYKYIMACKSTVLAVVSEYYEFFTRGLMPDVHYKLVSRGKDMCKSLKKTVEWGNNDPAEAEAVGIRGQEFLRDELSMNRVYEYMLHLLREYAKLQRFEVRVPPMAQRVTRESIWCVAEAFQRNMLQRSVVQPMRSTHAPCLFESRN